MALDNQLPSKKLMQELNEVSDKAALFQKFVEESNHPLPGGFPELAVLQELTTLQKLPKGTAEGCKEPLSLMTKRLPQLRSTYIVIEEARFTNQVHHYIQVGRWEKYTVSSI